MTPADSVKFSVVNTTTNEVVDDDLSEGETLSPGDIGIIVDPGQEVGSVRFTLNGQVVQTENVTPYALFGDKSGDFFDGSLPSGQNTVTAEFFSGSNGSGTSLGSATRSFSVESDSPPPPPPPVDDTLAEWADHITFHFDGNNNDPDDIAAVAVATLLTLAADLEDKTTFYYGNNLAEVNNDSQLANLEASGEFARSQGVEALNYQDDVAGTTDHLVDLLESGQKVLMIEGGPMEAAYRALEQTDPSFHSNIRMVSHSSWNENRDVVNRPGETQARTWDDIARDFPDVEQIEIQDQNAGSNNDRGFNNSGWEDLENIDSPLAEEAREAMLGAPGAKANDPSDAGMLWYAITGQEDGTPDDAIPYMQNSGIFEDDPAPAPTLFELSTDHSSPLAEASYDAETGLLNLEFDYDRLLEASGEWGNARHIDGLLVNGIDYEIEIHPDDGPRDDNGRYIYDRTTMENTFSVDIGAGLDPEADDITFLLMDDYVPGDGVGTRDLYSFTMVEADTSTDPMPTPLIAVNAGGGAFTSAEGVSYLADDFGAGNSFSTNASISGTDKDELYQSETWKKGGFSYELATGNGTFDVELNFAEIWSGAFASGKRVFDVYVENVLVLDDLDISDLAGNNAALDFVGEVTVTDGALSIATTAETQNPKIAGFSVWESTGAVGDFAQGSIFDYFTA